MRSRVTVYIPAILENVAGIDADTKPQTPARGQCLIVQKDFMLRLARAGNRVDRRVEHRQDGISRVVHDPAVVVFDSFGEQFEILLEHPVGFILVLARQARVIDHVGIQDRRQFTGHSPIGFRVSGSLSVIGLQRRDFRDQPVTGLRNGFDHARRPRRLMIVLLSAS